mgnify:FL=1
MVLNILIIGTFVLYVYLAVLALRMKKPRTLSYWLLFASACCAAYWTFFSFFTYNAGTLAELERWFYISVLGMFLYFPLNLLFGVSVASKRRLKLLPAVLILLPGVTLFVLNFFYPVVFKDFVMGEKGWIFVPATGHILDLVWVIYAMGCFVPGIVLMIIRLRKTNLNREKKQMAVLITTQAAAMVFLTCEFLLHDFLINLRPATISPVVLSVWIIGMVIAVKRYEFLAITPESVSREILNAIDNIVILVNEEERITYMNDNALSLFGIPYRKLEQRQLQDFLAEPPEGGSPIPATAPDASASGSRTQTDPGGEHPAPAAAAASSPADAVPGGGDLGAASAGSPDPVDPGIGDDPAGPTFPGPMQPAGPAVPGSAVPRPVVPRPAVPRPAVPRPAQDESVTVTLTFDGPDEDPTEVTVKVNRVVDRYGDLLGYLLIGSPNSPEESLQERFSLTDRETAIVSKAAKGWRNSRIAEDLGISEQTVKNHLAAVYKKLGVSNRVELLNLISVE